MNNLDNEKGKESLTGQKKLAYWAKKLLDTGKRNNLISFKDTKYSTAEVIYPNCEKLFAKCTNGHVFEVFDPKIPDIEMGEINENDEDGQITMDVKAGIPLTRDEYKSYYSSRMKSEKYILLYAGTPNPVVAVKKIQKKAKEIQEETGINVAYLAFGFIKWREKEDSEIFFRAPLLLVHVNVISGSITEPFKIEISDDDVIVNPTFNYLLQAEYGTSLPDFEETDSLETYYSKVTPIVDRLGWELLNECKLGTFSFQKINMYEDLKKNSSKILENDNVRLLLGEPVLDDHKFSLLEAEQTLTNPLIDLHTVVDADSSQIEAIEMAKSGRSFVLQGPPGTGKSQTITNIIAECLHDGKKVLFVSEKQAALNVVFDKLKKAGLADFCLELHSAKANKKAVIAELNRTMEVPKSRVSSSVQEDIGQKREAQHKLDAYEEALHKERTAIGCSLYQLFEYHSAQRDYLDVPYSISNINTKGQDYLRYATDLLGQYSEFTHSIGQDYRKNEWFGFTDPTISFDEKASLKTDLETLLTGFKSLQKTNKDLERRYGAFITSLADTRRWQTVLDLLAHSDVVTPQLLSQKKFIFAKPYLDELKRSSETIVPARNSILDLFKPEVLQEIDGKEIYTKLTGQYRSFFSRLFSIDYKNFVAEIRLFTKEGDKLRYSDLRSFADKLMHLQSAAKKFEESEAPVKDCLGAFYSGPDTDWDNAMTDLEKLGGAFSDTCTDFGSLAEMSKEGLADNRKTFLEYSNILKTELNMLNDAEQNVASKFTSESLDLENGNIRLCIKKIEGCVREYDKLGNWIRFMNLQKQLKGAELSDFIDLAIQYGVEPDRITGCYKKTFYKTWIENIIFTVPELSSFSRITHDQALKSFTKKDQLQYEISKNQIRSELSMNRPNLDLVAGGSEVSVLRREGQKKRKQMPIRRILSETGELVQIIKPCFLMSPLSVSTFLDPEIIHFDTVVFDEASQIFPQDAVGAIYRGNQLIVVGDSKQMPPSNFFDASLEIDDEDEEVGDVDDFESLLDVCSASFATERLAWHYRSHYEQLIAFSNLHFYNNKLITFPSAAKDHKGIGVDYYHVDGIFDRNSKTNRAEAQFIVDLIFKNIREYPNRSLGVVAFSVAQQNLIDRLLSKRREADPTNEWFFQEDRSEPFFIKNLETVQGDERDTIIFSVAYAKDAQGRFIHNFGPLNREGGERRLNVAVTRAKDNVQLVASIRYTDINLNNSKSEGVRLLRAYLDYAENGEAALERAITVSDEDQFDSYFEQEVCDYLRDQGFTVDTQVGCSGYRIDLGLRKPDSSNYIMAIECDGATYHSSRNARDRDILRQRILENMDWRFYRIWSTDWYRNNKVEKERLLKAAKEAVSGSGGPRKPDGKKTKDDANDVEEEVKKRFVSETSQSDLEFPKYNQVDAMNIVRKHAYMIQPAMREILTVEAPLSEEYILKRIAPLLGRMNVTSALMKDFKHRMKGCESFGIVSKDGFLYLKDMDEIKLRVPGDRRDVKYISIEELADGLFTLIKQNVSVSREGLFRTITVLLGFNRTGEVMIKRFEQALLYLKGKGVIKDDNGVLSVR